MLLGLLWWFSRKDVKNPMANANETDLVVFFKCLESLVLPKRREDFGRRLRIAIQLANSHIKTDGCGCVGQRNTAVPAPRIRREGKRNALCGYCKAKMIGLCNIRAENGV